MTCEDIRMQMESGVQAAEAEFWSDPRVATHIAACEACSHSMQQRQSLQKDIQLVREAVGPVSESLDAAVLASYRRIMAERSAASLPVHNAHSHLGWSLVAALVLIATAVVVFSTRKPMRTMAPLAQPSLTTVAAVPQTPSAQPPIRSVGRIKTAARSHPVRSHVHPVTRTVASIPDEFRGLMFCDELSCGGGMDMIRIQLPASLVPRPVSGFQPTSGVVNAEVLIGPDGIARGIRIDN